MTVQTGARKYFAELALIRREANCQVPETSRDHATVGKNVPDLRDQAMDGEIDGNSACSVLSA